MCRVVFHATNVIRMLEDAKKRVLDQPYGEKVPEDAYTFILRYCVLKGFPGLRTKASNSRESARWRIDLQGDGRNGGKDVYQGVY